MQKHIDINCDLGEGVGNDELIMPHISSCNIACGAHAGDRGTMEDTVQLAIRNETKIGAHPSFPDRINFGRLEMDLPEDVLMNSIIGQIETLAQIISDQGARLHHVKPHGALYNLATTHLGTALVIVEALKKFDSDLILYAPYDSVMAKVASKNNRPVSFEVFADRNYNDDLTLVSRKMPHALLQEPKLIFEHAIRMIKEDQVKTISGKMVSIKADTICVHGDNPNAVEIVSYLSEKFKEVNIRIA